MTPSDYFKDIPTYVLLREILARRDDFLDTAPAKIEFIDQQTLETIIEIGPDHHASIYIHKDDLEKLKEMSIVEEAPNA